MGGHPEAFAIGFGDGVEDALYDCLASLREGWVVELTLGDGTTRDVEFRRFDRADLVLYAWGWDPDEGANLTVPVAVHLTDLHRIYIY